MAKTELIIIGSRQRLDTNVTRLIIRIDDRRDDQESRSH